MVRDGRSRPGFCQELSPESDAGEGNPAVPRAYRQHAAAGGNEMIG